MFDPWQPTLPAHLCDNCRYVTFNDPDEHGEFYCNRCKALIDGEDSGDVQDV